MLRDTILPNSAVIFPHVVDTILPNSAVIFPHVAGYDSAKNIDQWASAPRGITHAVLRVQSSNY